MTAESPFHTRRSQPTLFWLLLLLFVAASLLHGSLLPRPVQQPDWREADMASIARNFAREGMNPLYPRIDWRGEGPGFVEMEFPFLSWMTAALHRAGVDLELAGRLLTFLASLGAMALFFRLAADSLPPAGALAAAAVYASNPLVSSLATKLQPEAWMLLGYVASVRFFVQWIRHGRRRDYVISLAATSFAILAKATAAHVGLLLLFLALERWGARAFRDARLWAFALLSLLAPALWYGHAYGFWLDYGNSLGVSNEAHWIGLDLLKRPLYFLGILEYEIRDVWTPAGATLVVLAVLLFRTIRKARLQILWGLALAIYYVLTVRSSAHWPLHYYHVVSVPLAGLTLGLVVGRLPSLEADRWSWRRLLLAGGALALALGLFHSAGGVSSKLLVVLGLLAAGALGLTRLPERYLRALGIPWASGARRYLLGAPLVALLLLTLLLGLRSSYRQASRSWLPHPVYACAQEFRERIPAGSLVLASGGVCTHPAGGPAAHNAPYLFYWMDRKGFNLCIEDQTVENVESFRRRGAGFFAAEQGMLSRADGFETALRARYPLIAECPVALLFSLGDPGRGDAPPVR